MKASACFSVRGFAPGPLRALAAAALLCLSSGALFAREIPFLTGYVIDESGTLNARVRAELESRLEEHQEASSNQVVVCIIDSLEGEVLEEFSLRAVEEYKLGQAGKDNGVLLLIAKDDRKLRIEVGYGLEGSLTDALSARIIRNEIVPYFRDGEFNAGVLAGVDAILSAIAGEYTASEAASESERDATLADSIGEWVSKILTFVIGAGFLLYGAFMGLGFLLAIFQYGLFSKSWLWFLFIGPLIALIAMIPFAVLWSRAPPLALYLTIFAGLAVFKIWLHATRMGRDFRERCEPDESSGSSRGGSSSSSGSSSSWSSGGGGFSGGGGSFGGGGSSGSW